MDKKKKVLIAIGGLAALYGLALLVFWLVVKIKERGNGPALYGKADEATVGGSSASIQKWNKFPLKWGSGTSRNLNPSEVKKHVKYVQELCNRWMNSGLVVDGVWGDKTEKEVPKLKDLIVYDGLNARSAQRPFYTCVSEVQNPVSPNSKVQIFYAQYEKMVLWNKENKNRYKPLS